MVEQRTENAARDARAISPARIIIHIRNTGFSYHNPLLHTFAVFSMPPPVFYALQA
jgi:hypothetical protein